MGKQIGNIILLIISAFVLLAMLKYHAGVNNWLIEAFFSAITFAIGFLLGCKLAERNKKR